MKMKAVTMLRTLVLFTLLSLSKSAFSQNLVNWTKEQLLEPYTLAETIKTNKKVPVIISVGPGALIPGSIAIGSVQDQEHLYKLTKELKHIKKNTAVVVYCGCCPFEHCPNVRPAIDLLKKMSFTNYKLLNLPKNIKTDWIDKGYPTSKL